MNRREFLSFLGTSTLLGQLGSCALKKSPSLNLSPLTSLGLPPTSEDKLVTASGLDYKMLIKWGENISSTQKFGFNNDFIAFHPLSSSRALLWVNHEYINPVFIGGNKRTRKNVEQEMLEVGGSILEIQRMKNQWKVISNSPFNRRLDAHTKIPFSWDSMIKGQSYALGTMGNCAGGKTPWGTFLTCEENYDMFWGDIDRQGRRKKSWYQWHNFHPRPPEHYGWVVEVQPQTGQAKKLVSLGRFAHECAAVTKAKNGKVVAYSGDDSNDEHLYKFISHSENSLEKGTLYVASLEKGKWLSMDLKEQKILQKHFKTQTEVQIYAREAAKILGATPLDRPEDIEFDPLTGHVYIALTNNKPRKNYHGSILKIMEDQNDPASLTFSHDTFLTGGEKNQFSCPDNLVFDPKGNLWFTTDISGSEMNQGAYKNFGNNGLFVFMRSGKHQGEILRVASAPIDAEFTGPCFDQNYETLFLSVQHPGEKTQSLKKLTSTWPDGGIPRPSVVQLSGPLLNQIVRGKI